MAAKSAFFKSILFWLGLFVIVVTAPLFIMEIGHTETSRGFWVEFGSGLGFVALAMMILQFLLTARYRNIKPAFGHDGLLYFHRQSGFIAWLFVIGHFTVLFIADPAYTSYLDPTVNAARAIALFFVVILLSLLLASSYWRESFGLSYEWWRITHGVAALTVVVIGLGHALMVDFYTSELWKKGLWVLFTGMAMLLLLNIRLRKPLKISKLPYKVRSVKQETEDVWTLEVEADNHHGIPFNAGQFAWITVGETPFKLQQHPFSFSSSDVHKKKCTFTIKELGNFTQTIKELEPGTELYLEGPYGTFTLTQEKDVQLVFFAGGIGITPIISMLKSMRDRNDSREVTLLYGNKDFETIAFHQELEELRKELKLKVVHVLEEPPADWQGEEGFIDDEIMDRHLPEDSEKVMYYLNGPPVMQKAIEKKLKEFDVPLWRMQSESFEIV